MFIGQSVDLSPYRVFKAAEDIETGAFTAVSLTEDGIKTATDMPIGLLTGSPTIAAGEEANVQIFGGALWFAGEEIKAGDKLAAGEDGKAFKATEGKYIYAIALEAAQTDQVASVLIINGGKG